MPKKYVSTLVLRVHTNHMWALRIVRDEIVTSMAD